MRVRCASLALGVGCGAASGGVRDLFSDVVEVGGHSTRFARFALCGALGRCVGIVWEVPGLRRRRARPRPARRLLPSLSTLIFTPRPLPRPPAAWLTLLVPPEPSRRQRPPRGRQYEAFWPAVDLDFGANWLCAGFGFFGRTNYVIEASVRVQGPTTTAISARP